MLTITKICALNYLIHVIYVLYQSGRCSISKTVWLSDLCTVWCLMCWRGWNDLFSCCFSDLQVYVNQCHSTFPIDTKVVYSYQLKCYVPVLVGIQFGMTTLHFQQYFLSLINCHKFSDLSDFKDDWQDIVCKFSSAELFCFNESVQTHFNLSDHELSLEDFHSTCEVHFQNSLENVARDHLIQWKKYLKKWSQSGMISNLQELQKQFNQEDFFQKQWTGWNCIFRMIKHLQFFIYGRNIIHDKKQYQWP